MKIPRFLTVMLHELTTRDKRQLLDWLQSNSNTVVVDELLLALKGKR